MKNKTLLRYKIVLLIVAGFFIWTAQATSLSTDVYSWGNVHVLNKQVLSISSSYYKTIALLEDSTIVEWGNNSYSPYRAAVLPKNLHSVAKVAAGYNFGLALKSDGTVVGWGDSASFSGTYPSAGVTVPETLTGVIDIAVGAACAYALKKNGTVVGWGGENEACADSIPDDLSDVKQIDGAGVRFAALKNDGSIVQWGILGVDTKALSTHDAVSISVGPYFGVAILKDSTLQAWGNTAPDIPEGLKKVVAVSAGASHVLILFADGTIESLGGTTSYGEGVIPDSLAGARFSGMEAGLNCSFLIREDGRVISWGYNYFGRTKPPLPMEGIAMATAGDYNDVLFVMNDSATIQYWGGETNASHPPSNMTKIKQVAMGNSFALALEASGTVRGWGGISTLQQTEDVDTLESVQSLDAGAYGIVLHEDGTVWVWGKDARSLSYSLSLIKKARAVAATDGAFFVLLSDSTVIGRAMSGSSSNFATVPNGLTGVVAISGGGLHALALKSDGTVVLLGSTGENDPPPGLSDVIAVAAGKYHSLALKKDGSVVAWGDNSYGQTDVPANLPPVRAIIAGNFSSVVLFKKPWTEPLSIPVRSISKPGLYKGSGARYDIQGRVIPAGKRIPGGIYLSVEDDGVQLKSSVNTHSLW